LLETQLFPSRLHTIYLQHHSDLFNCIFLSKLRQILPIPVSRDSKRRNALLRIFPAPSPALNNKATPFVLPISDSSLLFLRTTLQSTKNLPSHITMSNSYYGVPQYHSLPHSSHNSHGHHGRSRRGPRISSQNAHRQYKPQRSPKEVPETPTYNEYLQRLEAAKSFEFDDDELFCPFNLLTEDDVCLKFHPGRSRASTYGSAQLQSIHSSSGSDRGSLSSGSPEGSPLQQQVQPTPSFQFSSAPNTFNPAPSAYQQSHNMKLHQPMAQRTRNAIPIVDPSTRSVASPPLSVSPGRQMQQQQRYMPRHW